ncbi:DUF6777 domain-containing protein [Streptomyces sp. NPDC048258]|uniref:DUF6777 domain-containing protein n=1 Tax=Streptomyces sp. NPDC048258 TaxID=3365527 RepID=UPI00371DCF8D
MVGLVSMAMSIGLFLVGRQAQQEHREIFLQPTGEVGPDPFTSPLAGTGSARTVAGTDPATPTAPSTSGEVAVASRYGSEPGLYGGVRKTAACDPRRLMDFLRQNPGPGQAWAGVLGMATADLPRYVAWLTPVVLTGDIRVTDHRYRDGRGVPFQAVLQGGTAVLLDWHGVPRVRCQGGNPLLAPVVVDKPVYTGQRWPGFEPGRTVVVVPSRQPLRGLVLTDVTTGDRFARPVGGTGPTDRDVAIPSGTSRSGWTPTVTPPPALRTSPQAAARTAQAR